MKDIDLELYDKVCKQDWVWIRYLNSTLNSANTGRAASHSLSMIMRGVLK